MIERLVLDLGNEKYAIRDSANQQLREMGDSAERALRKALAGKPSAELRRRAERLLTQATSAPSPARLRETRAVELLERTGTPEAREILQTIAGGAADAHLTHEAVASLSRLRKQ